MSKPCLKGSYAWVHADGTTIQLAGMLDQHGVPLVRLYYEGAWDSMFWPEDVRGIPRGEARELAEALVEEALEMLGGDK